MTNALFALSLGLGFALLAATAAPAQGHNCGDRAFVVERLASLYGESRRSLGLGANNTVVEVFASDATGSWTITSTSAAGVTCLVASGQAFSVLTEGLPNLDTGT